VKVAALDLGSNTFLLLVCDVIAGKITKIYQDEIRVTKLGQGVHAHRKFHPEALERADACLREFSQIIRSEKPERVLAMATSAARDVSNGEELFKLGNKHDIPIQIIPGHMEAEITFRGATFDYADKKGVCIIDVGGGSTEVLALDDGGKPQGVSVDVGSVRLTEMFVTGHPVPKTEVKAILDYTSKKFEEARDHFPKGKLSKIVGVAGTPTTLAAVLQKKPYSDDLVHGYKIKAKVLRETLDKLASMDLESRKTLVGMDPLRADVIVAGTAILYSALKALKKDELVVSTRGVRYGVALHAAREERS